MNYDPNEETPQAEGETPSADGTETPTEALPEGEAPAAE